MSSLRHIATEPANLSQKLAGNACNPDDAVNHDRTSSHSDSDISNSTASVSQASLQSEPPPQMKSSLTLNLPLISGLNVEEIEEEKLETKKVAPSKRRQMRRGSEWEILEGLKDGQRFEEKPEKFEGYMMKRRKWPLKGWHKVSIQLYN
ncbi:oxysterol-binding protein-related protein 6-like [Centruroides sculpturatus]|uniref:oxysterol-binding protein-related protein 6-like n=1 Tax=Centruroides sculpturatus TaxID=218467 RepID=UPI000C6CC3ED|nr:oxysterol-binding protein-related protein 6-like [Centruroides sculpturatus]